MIIGSLNQAARKVRVYKMNSILAQRMGNSRSFTDIKNEKKIFNDALPKILDTIVASPEFTEITEFPNTIKQILDYNLTGGKCTRALSTILTYKFLEKPEKITEESMERSRILAWCVEMAFWLILDDITDKSDTRRQKPCWYKCPDVGMRAVNDSALIYGIMLKFLKTNFEHLPIFPEILSQFNEALIYTATGQHLDYAMKYQKEKNYILFTSEFYEDIVKYKTTYYSHVLPVYLGMLLANIEGVDILRKVKEISYKIGSYHQIQDDFSDAFWLQSGTDKLGTDIQEGKCSWLAVTALQNCNETQRKIFTKFYGSSNPEHEEEIIKLYEELKLPEIFEQEKRKRYEEITRLAHDFNTIPKATELFLEILRVFSTK